MTVPSREAGTKVQIRSARIVRIEHQARHAPATADSALRLVELSPEAILVCRQNKLALLNQAAVRLLGARHADELLDKSLFDFIDPDFHTLFHERARLPALGADSTPFVEQTWIRLDGSRFHAEVAANNLLYNDAPVVQIVVRDISDRKRNEELQLGQNRILNMVATGAELPDILAEIAQFIETQSAQRLYSIQILDADGAMLGRSATRCLHAACKQPSSWPILGKEGMLLGALTLRSRESVVTSDEDLELLSICTRLAGLALESRASQERIRFLAHYDGLTSLPNRFLFREYLDQALRDAKSQGSRFAVFFLDFDKFKEINDGFGHAVGDQVLRRIAGRLQTALRDSDRIARMGGDEFYVLLEDIENERQVAAVAQKLLDEASRPVCLGGQQYQLSASIGIAIYPGDGADANSLLENADCAMYRVKELGRDGYRFYSGSANCGTE